MVAMVAHAQGERGRRIHKFKVYFSCRASSKLALAVYISGGNGSTGAMRSLIPEPSL